MNTFSSLARVALCSILGLGLATVSFDRQEPAKPSERASTQDGVGQEATQPVNNGEQSAASRAGSRRARQVPPELVQPIDLARASKAEDLINQKLKDPVSLEFVQTALGDVVEFLRDLTKVNIVLDRVALDAEGINTDTQVTIHVEQISFKSALKILLEQINLTYIIEDDVLKITGITDASNKMITKFYPVADIVVCVRGEDDLCAIDFTSQIDLITRTIDNSSWQANGGTASIEQFAPGLALVINQTEANHDRIVELLSRVRKLQARLPELARVAGLPNSEKLVRRAVAEELFTPDQDSTESEIPAPRRQQLISQARVNLNMSVDQAQTQLNAEIETAKAQRAKSEAAVAEAQEKLTAAKAKLQAEVEEAQAKRAQAESAVAEAKSKLTEFDRKRQDHRSNSIAPTKAQVCPHCHKPLAN